MVETVRRRKRYDIDMDMGETPGWHFEVSNGWCGVPGYFRSLARKTFTGPFRTIGVDVWPDKLTRHNLSSAVRAGVAKVVDGVENVFPHGEGNKRSGKAI